MADTEQHDPEDAAREASGEDEERQKAEEAKEKHEQAQETISKLEDEGPPEKLEDWPEDEAKYITYGGPEGEHSYDEGPEEKLGPPLQRKEGGAIELQGEEGEVDDPDEYKAEPIPGGPTDPETPETHGEKRKREKIERMYGEGEGSGDGEGGESESRDTESRSDEDS